MIAVVISTLFGLVPIAFAMLTDQGDELCDPDFYYSAEPTCVLLWNRALMAFGLYFGFAVLLFIALAVAWLVWSWVMNKLWSR